MRRSPADLASSADRHRLYELAVQAPDRDARWLTRWFRRAAGRPLRHLREDFAGTAAIARAFVQGGADRRALAVDADPPTVRAAARAAAAALTAEQQRRLRICCADVRQIAAPRADLTLAANFSYCVFHARAELLGYLRSARAGLRRGGFLLLDVQGGGLLQRPFAERHRHRGFAHIWEQRAFDPIRHRIDCRIHFEFADGSVRRDAFVYDWRLWTLPELQDLLTEAGFVDLQVLWQEPRTGEFRRCRRAPAAPNWLAFVAGRRA